MLPVVGNVTLLAITVGLFLATLSLGRRSR
jgi:hypothetical protein